MKLHEIKRPSGLRRSYRRVGRGQSSGRGKQSGRGGKGQTARAGAKMRPEWRDIIKKLPKRRGFGKNRRRGVFALRPQPIAISLARVVSAFESGASVTPASLLEKRVVSSRSTMPRVKVIGSGKIAKKLILKGVATSATAKIAIEKAGGSVT